MFLKSSYWWIVQKEPSCVSYFMAFPAELISFLGSDMIFYVSFYQFLKILFLSWWILLHWLVLDIPQFFKQIMKKISAKFLTFHRLYSMPSLKDGEDHHSSVHWTILQYLIKEVHLPIHNVILGFATLCSRTLSWALSISDWINDKMQPEASEFDTIGNSRSKSAM